MNALVWFWAVVRNECRRVVREDSLYFLHIACSSPKGSAVICVSCLTRFLVRLLQTFVQARQTAVCLALQFVLCTVVTGTTFTLSCFWWEVSRVDYSAALVWRCASGPPLGSEIEGDRPPPLRRYPSVLDTGKMVAVEYEGETGLFHHRLILRTASTAAVLNTTGRMCDSPNGLFWILTPDGDVYPELLQVPRATGLVWLNERNEPIPTTMMPAGCHLEQVYEFGAHRRILLSPDVIQQQQTLLPI